MLQKRNEEGFTFVELLVVILIVGVLAAIAVPSFLSQGSKGLDACAKSMATTMHKAINAHVVQQPSQSYVGITVANLTAIEPSIRTNGCGAATPVAIGLQPATGSCTGLSQAARYCVRATSRSGNIFTIARAANGVVTRVCRRNEPKGGCRGSGTSGTW
ncbi:MAG: type II secretion system protein [Thermoleophilaceae bacterium]|nr:type II secretion system protein [Thermoleophilaceae bacterium]